ncbi:MAG: hypothetical protein ABFD16_06900 [Thermoguttaceae bacterium]|jgi:hypothetical protein
MSPTRVIHRGTHGSPKAHRAPKRLKVQGPLKHIYRLISFLDALYFLGDFLYRRSLRYSTATAAVCLLGYLGNFLPGVETYPARVAITLPLLVGSTTLLSGLLLKNIPNLFFTRLSNVAQAADLDLMEDYRKSEQDHHLNAIWERVYQFEWAVGSELTRIHPHPVECPPHVASDAGLPDGLPARGQAQFLRRARFALERDQSQPRQRYHLGLDLRFLEDWRNGAYFDRSDVKLIEQFEAAATLLDVKREAGHGQATHLCSLPRRLSQKFWTTMINRAIAVQVGEALTYLNRKHNTDYFNAQALLWPGEENQPWLAQFPDARKDLLQRRRLLLFRVFGRDLLDARRMLQRMALPCFLAATSLRAQFDPEYLDGSLGYTPLTDLEAAVPEPSPIPRYCKWTEQAGADYPAMAELLRSTRPSILALEQAEALRAVRIAMHVNRDGLRRLVRRFAEQPSLRDRTIAQAMPIIDKVTREKTRYSRLLVGLRVHHELTRLHHAGYLGLFETLYHSCEPAAKQAT